LWVAGNIYASNIIGYTANVITVQDPLLYLQPSGNVTYPYNYDIGFYSAFTGGTGNTYQHTGLIRDFNDNTWKLASNLAEPAGTTLTFDANTVYDSFKSGAITSTSTINATGNITGGNVLTGGIVSSTGNAIHGNILTGGLISATGNITGGNVLNNGISSVTGNITGGNILTGGIVSSTGNAIGGNILTGGLISATGNITGGNVLNNGISSVTGNITGGNVLTGGLISATGNITGGNLSVGIGTLTVGNIVTTGNIAGNIGNATNTFNTVFAQATTALYADLAENYFADAEYAPGTVVVFGGEHEITVTTQFADVSVAGAISTDPAYLMNSGCNGLPVALRGRVPVKVVGPVTKGDLLVTAGQNPGYATSVGRSKEYPLAVFAKAIETNTNEGEKTIIAVIL
jgi:hypothetical protein